MKNLLLLSCFVLSVASAQAQGTLELKTNVVPYIAGIQINLSGEYIIKKRFGVEASVWYGWDKDQFTDTDTATGAKNNILLKDSQMVLLGAGKYYFSPKTGGDRFFGGIALYHHFYLSYIREIPNEPPAEKPKSETGFGVLIGYKWIIKQHFLIEAELLGSISNKSSSGILPSLKLGYRL